MLYHHLPLKGLPYKAIDLMKKKKKKNLWGGGEMQQYAWWMSPYCQGIRHVSLQVQNIEEEEEEDDDEDIIMGRKQRRKELWVGLEMSLSFVFLAQKGVNKNDS